MYDSATCGRVAKSQRRLERPAPLQVAALSSAVKSRREITITTGLFKKKLNPPATEFDVPANTFQLRNSFDHWATFPLLYHVRD